MPPEPVLADPPEPPVPTLPPDSLHPSNAEAQSRVLRQSERVLGEKRWREDELIMETTVARSSGVH
jgi:hypothetical protein